ncbi:MAG TPA: CotH kinase family protein [Verrucomicrobiales bacterium]|nr:CotH kinase family protein [Verrucomicrobiales bacterium]
MPPPASPFATLRAIATAFCLGTGVAGARPDVVIHEILYLPADKTEEVQFVELYNAGPETAGLGGWFFSGAFAYVFPSGASLDAGQYLVLAQNKAHFDRRFGSIFTGGKQAFDEFSAGKLSASGEEIVLRDGEGSIVDTVDYRLGFPWPSGGGDRGPSIELIDPVLDNALGAHWRSALAPTPGKPNSRASASHPPALRRVTHEPSAPTSGSPVTVTARITSSSGISSAEVLYQVVAPGDYISIDDPRYETEWTALPMRDDGTQGDASAADGIFTAVVPGELQEHRHLLRYRVAASTGEGHSVRVPYEDDPAPNFAWFVYDGVLPWTGAAQPGVTEENTYDPALLTAVPVYHLITTRQDHLDAQFLPGTSRASGYTGSDYLWRGTLIYENTVYDHIGYRARGGVWRYAMGKNMWKFDFHRTQRFIARDAQDRPYSEPWRVLNFSALIQQGNFRHRGEQGLFESLGFELFRRAGIEAPRTHFVHFRIIENAAETNLFGSQYATDFQGLYLAVEQIDGAFLDAHGLPDGNVYKMESGTGLNGLGGELKHQGAFPEAAGSSDLAAFKTHYEGQRPDAGWWRTHLDLDRYYSYRAVLEAIHHYDIGAGKNYYYYHNPETGRWSVFPWDLDLTWDDGMYGDGNEPFRSRVLAIPDFERDYQNQLRHVLDLLYTEEQIRLLIDEKMAPVYTPGALSLVDADRAMWDYNPILRSPQVNPSKAGQGLFYQVAPTRDHAGMIDRLLDYARSRRHWMETNLLPPPSRLPNRPAVLPSGDPGFPANSLQFTSSPFRGGSIFAPQQFAAIQWRIARVTDPAAPGYTRKGPHLYEIDESWDSGEIPVSSTDLSVRIPAAAVQADQVHRVRVRHKNDLGYWSAWSEAFPFTPAVPDLSPYLDGLVLSEIMYHPRPATAEELALGFDTEDFEFLELANIGLVPLDLSPLRFTAGIDFDFANANLTLIAPGAIVLVVRHLQAFQQRYGGGLPVAGEYRHAASAVRLSNGGETVALSYGTGSALIAVSYDDDTPWPAEADGGGPSLELRQPEAKLDPGSPSSWTASSSADGTPGRLPGPLDSLSFEDWLSQHFTGPEKTDPAVAGPTADPDGDGNGNFVEFAFGTDPRIRDSLDFSIEPKPGSAPGEFILRIRAPAAPVAARLVIHHSPNLRDWRPLDPAEAALLPAETGSGGLPLAAWVIRGTGGGFLRIAVTP